MRRDDFPLTHLLRSVIRFVDFDHFSCDKNISRNRVSVLELLFLRLFKDIFDADIVVVSNVDGFKGIVVVLQLTSVVDEVKSIIRFI